MSETRTSKNKRKEGEEEKGNGRDKCFAHFYLLYLAYTSTIVETPKEFGFLLINIGKCGMCH